MPSLVEKLAQIAKTIPQLQMQGDNGQYQYLTMLQVCEAVRNKLFEAGIVIVPIETKEVRRNQPHEWDVTDEVIVVQSYLITDGHHEQDLICEVAGCGQDREGKATAIANTSCMKDLLKRMFLLAGVEDDAEAHVDRSLDDEVERQIEKHGENPDDWPISGTSVIRFNKACREAGISDKTKITKLETEFGIKIPSKLKRGQWKKAMEWAKWVAEGQPERGKNNGGTIRDPQRQPD